MSTLAPEEPGWSTVGCAGGAGHRNLHKEEAPLCAILVPGRPSTWMEN